MKNIIIFLIKKYQNIPGRFHYNCKFYPTCSEYMIKSIEKYGLCKGIYLGIKRLLKCNLFSKGGIDLIK